MIPPGEVITDSGPNEEGVVSISRLPKVFPPLPFPFEYDPTDFDYGPGWVRDRAGKIAQEVKEGIIAQAKYLEDQARAEGWIPIPSRQRDKQSLRRMAERLFLYAVKEESLEAIAEAETQKDPSGEHAPDTQAVSFTVHQWAQVLDIPLPPPKRSPGRPRKRSH